MDANLTYNEGQTAGLRRSSIDYRFPGVTMSSLQKCRIYTMGNLYNGSVHSRGVLWMFFRVTKCPVDMGRFVPNIYLWVCLWCRYYNSTSPIGGGPALSRWLMRSQNWFFAGRGGDEKEPTKYVGWSMWIHPPLFWALRRKKDCSASFLSQPLIGRISLSFRPFCPRIPHRPPTCSHNRQLSHGPISVQQESIYHVLNLIRIARLWIITRHHRRPSNQR